MTTNEKIGFSVICRNCSKKLVKCKEQHLPNIPAWKHEESNSHYCYPYAKLGTAESNLIASPGSRLKEEMDKLLPGAVGFLFAPDSEKPTKIKKRMAPHELRRRIKYLKEVILISHKNRYKPPKNVVEELNELIAIKKGELNGNKNNNHKEF